MAEPITPTPPLFDMSKATPIQGQAPLFDMSKATPIGGQQSVPIPIPGASPIGSSSAADAWRSLKGTVGDVGTGVAQGAANTVGSSVVGTAKLLNKIPVIGKYLSPQQGIDALAAQTAARSTPENTAQAVGKAGEQIGEFMLPGPGEEGAVARALPFMSRLGRLAKPMGRIAYQAGTTGLVNAAQGGSPVTGATAGAIGAGIGEGARAVAPAVAESALGITKRMRGYGKTPGLAALTETSGLAPETIENQAQQKLRTLTSGINSQAAAHSGDVSIQPAIDSLDQQIAKATAENNGQAIEQLNRVKDALTKSVSTGQPLPVNQPATGAMNLKRGLRTQFIKNWDPSFLQGTRAAAARASGSIDSSLDTALGPQFQSANQRISSLIPVAERSESLGRDPSIAQKVGGRLAAHTGALAGSAIGGAEGYRTKGIPGALVGGLTGLVAPEVLASPAVRMAAARVLHNPTQLISLLRGMGLQFDRPSQENKQ